MTGCGVTAIGFKLQRTECRDVTLSYYFKTKPIKTLTASLQRALIF